ncbi:MAG: hypothetical protein HON53_12880 [Planctomycetaceae bacterium]|jgi:hypothetical protein|nr:hypothetical protein [Planctomycetaceae bacterium]MBT6157924.1 hypothetical protein [Planctomycetaceae bacterium]MBT6487450.1 hypothetical protein [Planctomycetaceae bacterium]MBT6495575.1 hypothetical protein [Planctomycetaceae bacterium]
MRIFVAAAIFAVSLAGTIARADVESGPTVDEKVPALKVHAVVGPIEDKDVDYTAERKVKPTIYIFIQATEWSRPMARYLRKLDTTIGKTEGAAIVAVWLTDDKEKTRTYLPRAQMSLKMESTALALFPDSQTGPEGWGINADAFMTTVVTNKGRVAATFAYQSVNETDLPDVEKAFRKALKSAAK